MRERGEKKNFAMGKGGHGQPSLEGRGVAGEEKLFTNPCP